MLLGDRGNQATRVEFRVVQQRRQCLRHDLLLRRHHMGIGGCAQTTVIIAGGGRSPYAPATFALESVMPDDARRPTFDKSKLPSRHTTVGPERAPHRSYLYAMGLTAEQIAQPLVGVVSTWNEAAPCNIALGRQAQAAKRGVAEAGGTPREFTTITVTDGIAMGHAGMKASLVSREVIADSVELTMRGHCYDAMVGLAGCDKSL